MKPADAVLAAAVLGGLVSGCFQISCSTTRHGSDLEAPGSWKGRAFSGKPLDTAGLARWWRRFGDPVLSRLIEAALESSPDIRTALAKIEESRARRGVERAALFPSISGGASGQGRRTDLKLGGTSTDETWTGAMDLSWELDLFGRLRQNVKAATADLAQTTENFHGVQVTLAADVADAYVLLRATELQLDVYKRNIELRQETVQLTRWREQAGEGTTFDTQQAVSTLEEARAAIPTLQQTIEQTRNRLALLAGRTPGALDALLAQHPSVPRPPAMLATGIPAETLRQRPDVRAAEHGVEAAAARTQSAERERYPTFTLSGSLGMEALTAGGLFSPESATATVLGNLTAPIFSAGRIRETIQVQSAQEKQAVIAYEATVLKALSEVENALIAVQRTSERLGILDRAVVSAREAAALAAQSYQAGQVDLLEVLATQRTLLSLEEQQTIAIGNRASAHIQLYKSLGGGWSR